MANIQRIRVTLTGAQGLPGVSTFYALSGPNAVTDLQTFYTALVTFFPANVDILVEGSGETIDESTGDAVGSWSTAQPAGINATGAGGYAAPVGLLVSWITGIFVGGRRVRGHTFLVPMVNSKFDPDGQSTSAAASTIETAANALIAAHAGNMLVYHRETAEGAADGTGVAMTSALVSRKATVLRSRRD